MRMVRITFGSAVRSHLLAAAFPSPRILVRETRPRASASRTYRLLVLASNNLPLPKLRRPNNRRKRLQKPHPLRYLGRQEADERSAGARRAQRETHLRRAPLKQQE